MDYYNECRNKVKFFHQLPLYFYNFDADIIKSCVCIDETMQGNVASGS